MSDDGPRPIVFDATVISNLAIVDAADVDLSDATIDRPTELLERARGAVVPRKVVAELRSGVEAGHEFLRKGLEVVESSESIAVRAVEPPDSELDPGERHALALAESERGCIATDDAAARNRAKTRDRVDLTGTVGLLADAVHAGLIDAETADTFLRVMTEADYRSPVESVEQVLDTNEFTLLERVDRSASSGGAKRPPADATRETDFEE